MHGLLTALVVAVLLAFPAIAGEAGTPEDVLVAIADKIEARDVDGALVHFANGGGKDEEVLRTVVAGPAEKIHQFAEAFRHARLQQISDLYRNGYEGAVAGDEYRTYLIPLMGPNGSVSNSEIAMCGHADIWVVCNW